MEFMTSSGAPSGLETALIWGFGILTAIPMARIFHRAGFSWAWGLLCLLPWLGFFLCWIILPARRWTWREARP